MPRSLLNLMLLQMLAAGGPAVLAQAVDEARGLALEECRIADTAGVQTIAARCGHLTVPENPEEPGGPQIDLFVAVVPALNQTPAETPLTVIAGGPGGASTEFFVSYAPAFERIRRQHDVLLVDQRGTGRSGPLDCPVPEEIGLETDSVEAVSESTRECLSQLDGDPRFFTTSIAVRDLDRVREALGYPQLNLYGASYGTRVALHYLRRYPDRARTVIIDGVVPPDLAVGPGIALDAQAALERVFERCDADDDCSNAFPDLADRFDRLQEELRYTPATLSMPDPVTGELSEETLTELEFVAAVRLLSYHPDTVALLPLLLHTASEGNPGPLAAQARMVVESLSEALSYGMHNAIVCTEDVPFYQPAEIDASALAATYLGARQVEILQEICKIWPRGVMDEDFKDPVVSDNPVLILSGGADPVTPSRNGDHAALNLSNSLHIVGAGQGHGLAIVGCVPRLLEEFVDSASLDGLDTSCVELQGPSPFFLSFSGPAP